MEDSLTRAADAIAYARKAGATAADALCYASTSLSVSHRMGQPEGLERAESNGIGLRVFVGDCSAIVSSSDMSSTALQEMAARAVVMAKLAPADPFSGLADAAILAQHVPELELADPQEPDARTMQRACAEAEDAARSVQGITNSEGADASYGASDFALVTSNGFAKGYRSTQHSLSVCVLAGTGTAMERDYDYSNARFASDLRAPAAIGAEAARRTLARLNPRKVATQQVPVVFDPRVSRSLLRSFLSAINGSSVARGTSFLKEAMHTQMFNSAITIVDDPHIKRGLGSRPFDGEGLPTCPRELVKDGVLQSWLLDLRSAKKLGLASTGHASRGMGSPPSPSSSNTSMKPGPLAPETLMADIADGFYVTDLIGMGVNLVTGDYSQGASGFWIKNGRIEYPVSEVTVAGKLPDMFRTLTPANDLRFDYATNAPTVRIEGMMVAGQ